MRNVLRYFFAIIFGVIFIVTSPCQGKASAKPEILLNSTSSSIEDDLKNDTLTGYGPVFKNSNILNRLVVKPTGNTIKFKCPANGDPEPTIDWTKDGKIIERRMGQVHYSKWSISLEDLTPEDSGAYDCKVCNIHNCINFTSKLEVHDRFLTPPKISEGFPKNLTVLENSTAIFECPVLSDLAVHIEWAKFYQANSSQRMIPQKLEIDDNNPEVLKLENVTLADEGWYICNATNSLGGIISKSAYLQVFSAFNDPMPPHESDQKTPTDHSEWYIWLVAFLILLLVASVVIMMFLWRKYLKAKNLQKEMELKIRWMKKNEVASNNDLDEFSKELPN